MVSEDEGLKVLSFGLPDGDLRAYSRALTESVRFIIGSFIVGV